jgi:hypothetical protein
LRRCSVLGILFEGGIVELDGLCRKAEAQEKAKAQAEAEAKAKYDTLEVHIGKIGQ